MALDARSNNTVYNWSPKTGYVARDFLIETQMLSGSNPNLFSTFACNGYGQYPYEYVQLLWDDTRNSLLAVMVCLVDFLPNCVRLFYLIS